MCRMPLEQTQYDIALRASIGGWFGSWLNVGILILTVAILENNRRNTANTQKMVSILEDINNKLG